MESLRFPVESSGFLIENLGFLIETVGFLRESLGFASSSPAAKEAESLSRDYYTSREYYTRRDYYTSRHYNNYTSRGFRIFQIWSVEANGHNFFVGHS